MLPAGAPRGSKDIHTHAHVPDWLNDSLNRDRSGPHNYWFVIIVFPLGAAAALCFITVACCVKDCSANSSTAGAVGLATPTMVTVPAGAQAGQTLQLNHPRTGQLVSVVVPQGLVRSTIVALLVLYCVGAPRCLSQKADLSTSTIVLLGTAPCWWQAKLNCTSCVGSI